MKTNHDQTSSVESNVALQNYGSLKSDVTLSLSTDYPSSASGDETTALQRNHSGFRAFTSLKDKQSRVAFLDSTKNHHHYPEAAASACNHGRAASPAESDSLLIDSPSADKRFFLSHSTLRKLALDLSLWINIFILLTKMVAYLETYSLSVLAALVDSILDVVSQFILYYTEHRSSKTRSSAHYPAGASRLEPLGVLSCAALMGFASFGVLKEAFETLYDGLVSDDGLDAHLLDDNWSSFWSMSAVVIIKLGLWLLCKRVGQIRLQESKADDSTGGPSVPDAPYYVDTTLEALSLDHWNDMLSNAVAAIALLCAIGNEQLWILDPIGAIIISVYIIFSWWEQGQEQIEHLTGKVAPADFIEELFEIANSMSPKMEADVVRAYHFGPKFLVEIEVVLPRDTLLFESHDLGMELQYEIESREEVERCFVHIDYEARPYDEHVVSKVPELRERYRPYKRLTSAVSL